MNFDVVVIGSSPVALLEAAYWQSQGKKTCIIEKGRIGGNWSFCSMFGYKNIEVGPHIFFGNKRGFATLEKLGLKIHNSSVWNFSIREKKMYKRYYQLRQFLTFNLHDSSSPTAKINNFFEILKNGIKNFTLNRVGYLKSGCYELLSTILDLKIFDEITFVYSSCKSIQFKNDRFFLELNNNTIHCDKVITTQSSDINYLDIKFNQKYIPKTKISINKLNSAQVTIIAKNVGQKLNFTKFQITHKCTAGTTNLTNNDKKIKYISDITSIVKNQNKELNFSPNTQVLSLAIDADQYGLQSSAPNIAELFSDLQNMHIISKKSELVNYDIFFVKSKILTPESAHNINIFFEGKIVCLLTDSLVDSISDNNYKYNKGISLEKGSKVINEILNIKNKQLTP